MACAGTVLCDLLSRSGGSSVMSEDDRRAFDEAMRDVRPLKHEPRVQPTARPAARAEMTRRARHALIDASRFGGLSESLGEEIAFRRDGVTERTFRRLREGAYSIEAEFDLHGLTAAQAQIALKAFMADSVARGLGCVRVVHGKGAGSGPEGPVLKNLVHHYLALWDQVLAYVTALPRHGGHGAIYVLLNRRR
jgi:DNA-nicking Smr family endonuclease